jgi:hypothetical protein
LRPACQVFVKGASDADVRALIRILKAQAKKSGDAQFKGFIFFIDGDAEKIKKLNSEESADNIALGTLPSNDEAIKLYAIHPDAKSTVLVYNKKSVTARFVDFNAKTDSASLTKQIEKIWAR